MFQKCWKGEIIKALSSYPNINIYLFKYVQWRKNVVTHYPCIFSFTMKEFFCFLESQRIDKTIV